MIQNVINNDYFSFALDELCFILKDFKIYEEIWIRPIKETHGIDIFNTFMSSKEEFQGKNISVMTKETPSI